MKQMQKDKQSILLQKKEKENKYRGFMLLISKNE